MTSWEAYLRKNASGFLEDLIEFCRIPSISSLPEHTDDVKHAAASVAERLKIAGIEGVQILSTKDGGHPVVYGHWWN